MIQNSFSLLQPSFRYRVQAFIKLCQGQNINFKITETLRTFDRSDELYAQGRTTPGKIVTNSKAGQSFHNYGLAIDAYPLTQKGTIDVNFDRSPELMALMKIAAKIASTQKINWGGNFTKFMDFPHFQDGNGPGIGELKVLYPDGWMPGTSIDYTRIKA